MIRYRSGADCDARGPGQRRGGFVRLGSRASVTMACGRQTIYRQQRKIVERMTNPDAIASGADERRLEEQGGTGPGAPTTMPPPRGLCLDCFGEHSRRCGTAKVGSRCYDGPRRRSDDRNQKLASDQIFEEKASIVAFGASTPGYELGKLFADSLFKDCSWND